MVSKHNCATKIIIKLCHGNKTVKRAWTLKDLVLVFSWTLRTISFKLALKIKSITFNVNHLSLVLPGEHSARSKEGL